MSHESNIVGALMLDASRLDEVLDLVRPEAFRETNARKAYIAIIQACAEGLTPDLPTIAARVRDYVDPIWLTKTLDEAVPSNVCQYARELARANRVRQYRELAIKVANKANDNTNPEDLAAELEAGLETLSAGVDHRKDTSTEAVANRYLKNIEDIKNKRIKLIPCHTVGLIKNGNMDTAIVPYWYGGLSIVVSAYTTSGKSAFACNLALCEAEAGANVLIFSNEMGEFSYVNRAVGYFSGIPYGRVRTYKLHGIESDRIDSALVRFSSLPIHIIESAHDADEITRRIRRMQYTFRPDIVIIDYLQNLAVRPDEKRYESLCRQSKALIALAKKYEFSLVMVSQIDNQSAREPDPSKNIMAVKGSGDVAADADIFIELIRNSIDKNKEHHIVRIVRKNREQGTTGLDDLYFNRSFTRIQDHPDVDPPDFTRNRYDPSSL